MVESVQYDETGASVAGSVQHDDVDVNLKAGDSVVGLVQHDEFGVNPQALGEAGVSESGTESVHVQQVDVGNPITSSPQVLFEVAGSPKNPPKKVCSRIVNHSQVAGTVVGPLNLEKTDIFCPSI